jgi:hypothetical protein
MTSRSRRLLASLPVLALAPLLVAPKGCHFGDGDVPLGQNGTGGDAGMGGDGSSGSETGGNATSGNATGGRSGSGGTSGAHTGAGSTGGAGTGGSGPNQGACIETLSPFDGENRHGLEFTDEDVRELLGKDHLGTLSWSHGPAALTLALVGVRQYYVESDPNPDYPFDLPVTCENHVRAVAIGRVWTSNGEIDATIHDLKLNIAIPTLDGPGTAADRLEASSVATIAAADIGGSYGATIDSAHCFHSLQLNLGINRTRFDGELVETRTSGPCGAPTGAVIGTTAGSWACADDCRTAPSTTIVVEAESCDGIGEQLTHAGDDATFTRSGDTLSRAEQWGCGCPQFSKFVMAWSRRSPLEVRLCLDERADFCEAGCGWEISYDLSTAFRTAGTSDYRFVD